MSDIILFVINAVGWYWLGYQYAKRKYGEVDDEQTATETTKEIKDSRAKKEIEIGNPSVGVFDNIVSLDSP